MVQYGSCGLVWMAGAARHQPQVTGGAAAAVVGGQPGGAVPGEPRAGHAPRARPESSGRARARPAACTLGAPQPGASHLGTKAATGWTESTEDPPERQCSLQESLIKVHCTTIPDN